MSNENKAIFEAFAAKAASIHIIGGTFGTTDVELSVQRHNDDKLQVSVGGLDAPFAIAVLDALGIKIDDDKEDTKKRRDRKVKREAEKLAVEDEAEAAEEAEEAPKDPPKKQRRDRKVKQEVEKLVVEDEAEEVVEEAPAPPPEPAKKQRRKRRTKAELAAAKAAEEEAEEAVDDEEEEVVEEAPAPPPEPTKKQRRKKAKPEPEPEPAVKTPEEDFSLSESEQEAIGNAQVVEDVVEIVLDALPDDVDAMQGIAAVVAVRNHGIAPALKGWTDSQIAEAVNGFFE